MATSWITLATNDNYAIGALVLAHSLKSVGTQHGLHILYTNGVSPELQLLLESTFTHGTLVNVLDSNDSENLTLIGRPDLGVTFTKLHCWRLTQYSKCVFLDADTLFLKNADELFERPDFSAAADIGWPDFFNSGVFVFSPSLETYRSLVALGLESGSFDGGDQGLLNAFYNSWRDWDSAHRLPFIYNMTAGAIYTYAAALKRHGADVKVVHFLGAHKPWHSTESGIHVNDYLTKWHDIFNNNVKQHLPDHVIPGYGRVNTWCTYMNSERPLCSLLDGGGCVLTDTYNITNVLVSPITPELNRSPSEPCNYIFSNHLSYGECDRDQNISSSPSSSSSLMCDVISAQSVIINKPDQRYEEWERGAPDYTGRDAFENIQRHIDRSLNE